MELIEKIYRINSGLVCRFQKGNSPFEIMTRLLEEAGELAEQVGIFEDTGIKREKHGAPDRGRWPRKFKTCCDRRFRLPNITGLRQRWLYRLKNPTKG
ncbi:MAG TPA: hypothetical protein PKG95_05255 [Anaerolineaceae bacterium]|jgi:hypothetical protein|nr:hypothetical protein [Anaerolineaceae bacterium]